MANNNNDIYVLEEDDDDFSLSYSNSSNIYNFEDDEGITTVPRFKIDLDKPASSRWNNVIDYYKGDLMAAREKIIDEYINPIFDEVGVSNWGNFLLSTVSTLASGVASMGLVYYSKELKGFANRSGIPYGEMVLMQFAYEAAALCTSVVSTDPDNNDIPYHIRTMDWEGDFLKPLTVEYEFIKNNKTVLICTSWVGYIGVLTGMKPGTFSASVNFRTSGDPSGYLQNVKKALGGSWPIGYLLREVLTDCESFEDGCYQLENCDLIAPVYFTVCGTKPGEGRIITRSRTESLIPLNLDDRDGTIAQTNLDHWEGYETHPHDNVLFSIARRKTAINLFSNLETNDEETLWETLSCLPILNSLTIYGTYMHPASGKLSTRLAQRWGLDINEARSDYRGKQIHGLPGFSRCDNPLPYTGTRQTNCGTCGRIFRPEFNPEKGHCGHSGTWHDTFDKCNKLKCAYKLKTNIGKCHWSCCYSTYQNSPCPNSGPHVEE